MSVVATIFAIGGFICQFVGLRALHWSATIIQLGATLLMTAIRSWIRRGLADKYQCLSLPSDPDGISMTVGFRCVTPMRQRPNALERDSLLQDVTWGIPTANDLRTWRGSPWDSLYHGIPRMKDDDLPMEKDPRITIRSRLQQFSTNQEPLIRVVENLYTAFSRTLKLWEHALQDNTLYESMVFESEKLSWLLPVHSYDFE
jgi:hypothetical protein